MCLVLVCNRIQVDVETVHRLSADRDLVADGRQVQRVALRVTGSALDLGDELLRHKLAGRVPLRVEAQGVLLFAGRGMAELHRLRRLPGEGRFLVELEVAAEARTAVPAEG